MKSYEKTGITTDIRRYLLNEAGKYFTFADQFMDGVFGFGNPLFAENGGKSYQRHDGLFTGILYKKSKGSHFEGGNEKRRKSRKSEAKLTKRLKRYEEKRKNS